MVDIAITENPYVFVPDTLTFEVGKPYLLKFKPAKEDHTFTVAGLQVNILVPNGQAIEQEMKFNDTGTYQLVCILHEQLGQIGKVIVK